MRPRLASLPTFERQRDGLKHLCRSLAQILRNGVEMRDPRSRRSPCRTRPTLALHTCLIVAPSSHSLSKAAASYGYTE